MKILSRLIFIAKYLLSKKIILEMNKIIENAK